MVVDVQISVGDHRPTAIPSALADDVDTASEEGVGVANDRTDVEVVLPILDGNVEGMLTEIQIGNDRFVRPVTVSIDHISAVTIRQQLGVEVGIIRPRFGQGPDSDLSLRLLFGHTSSVEERRGVVGY